MTKKRIELTDTVETLVEKYLELTEDNLDNLANQALKYYVVKRLKAKDVKEALKQKDIEPTKCIDDMLKNNINNWDI